MLKKIVFTALVMGIFASNVFASGPKLYCNNVGGTEEWTINVDLNKKVASFFDNDSWVEVPLREIKPIQSMPPQTLYIFEGRDTSGAPNDRLRITFNSTRLMASVTLRLGRRDQKTLQALGGCHFQR